MLSTRTSIDAPLLTSLVHAAWAADVDPRSSGHRFRTETAEKLLAEGAVALVAVNELDEVLGCVFLASTSTEVELMKLAVPFARSQGVGSFLVDAALKKARALGAEQVRLAVSVYQPHLVRYYARFGFTVAVGEPYLHASPLSPPPIVMLADLTNKSGPGQSSSVDLVGTTVRALTTSGLAIIPTETVYGLAALATDPVAVRRVFATKGRPVDHPLIVHIANAEALDYWATAVPEGARRLAAAFWPGPLTLVLRKHQSVLAEVTGGLDTVGLRVPNHPLALAVIASLGEGAGVAAPSANRFGRVSPTTAAAAANELADVLLPTDVVLDGGPSTVGVESTIVDMTTEPPTILRPGGLPVEAIEELLQQRVNRHPLGPSRAPGMLASHYAPRAGVLLAGPDNLRLVVRDALLRTRQVGVLGPVESVAELPESVVRLQAPDRYVGETLAPVLYERLREADELGLDVLVVSVPPEEGMGWAVADRLRRAAHGSAHQTQRPDQTQRPGKD